MRGRIDEGTSRQVDEVRGCLKSPQKQSLCRHCERSEAILNKKRVDCQGLLQSCLLRNDGIDCCWNAFETALVRTKFYPRTEQNAPDTVRKYREQIIYKSKIKEIKMSGQVDEKTRSTLPPKHESMKVTNKHAMTYRVKIFNHILQRK